MFIHRQYLNAFKVLMGLLNQLHWVLFTGEIMILSTGIGNGLTVVICTLINPLQKLSEVSCIKLHNIQFQSFHFCDFYSLSLMVHHIPNTHAQKKIIKMLYMLFKISYRVLSHTEQLAQACLEHGKLHDFTNYWHNQNLL